MLFSMFLGSPGVTNPSICQNNVCANGGTCEGVPGGGYRCICRPGFTGARCDISTGTIQ